MSFRSNSTIIIMNANVSVNTLPYPSYYVYGITCFFDILLSSFLLGIIFSSRKFRIQKEYIMLAANFFHEILAGSASFIAGIWRLEVYWNNTYIPYLTRGLCFYSPHLLLFIIVFPGSGLVTMFTSIDRLLAITIPIRYYKFSRRYALFLMGGGYSLVLGFLIVAAIIVYATPGYASIPVYATCDWSAISYPIVNDISRIARSATTIIGVLLYLPITYKLHSVRKAHGDYSKMNVKQRKNLIRFNIIACFLVTNEMLFLVIPDIILMNWPGITIASWLYYLTVLKGFLTSIIVLVIQKEIRMTIYNLIVRRFGKQSNAFVTPYSDSHRASDIVHRPSAAASANFNRSSY